MTQGTPTGGRRRTSGERTTWQRVTALVPLGIVSAAVTAALVNPATYAGPTLTAQTTPESETATEGVLPDGTSLPSAVLRDPATVSSRRSSSTALASRSARATAASTSSAAIPDAALVAYQRAESIMGAADAGCRLDWTLLGAIGRVESDHGRYGGNVLDADGVARPGILGPRLTGAGGTTRVEDTDKGRLDGDTGLDRAVGPMQFIPSTWSLVGVDADGDDRRDPQDIDDAALAAGVYLCAGDTDLGTTSGLREAVYRYNHSDEYVDLVLEIMDSYAAGDYSAVPTSVRGGDLIQALPEPQPVAGSGGDQGGKGTQPASSSGGSGSSSAPSAPAPSPSTAPSGGGNQGGSGGSSGSDTPVDTTTPSSAGEAVGEVVEDVASAVPSTGVDPVDETLTRAEALAQCTLEGVIDNPLTAANELEACVQGLLNP
ncbi:lytic transglycosylase domain-containing protein [Nocardioides bruguierae]|uniref:lytic transglycosylase domain-containing protein n=1 Tax=Nocardioides bruguierae TaxID=2945102 RepID=UPI00202008F3|nr:lytic transglycosylase domain-containing protein [Nocardioides bruguierae]MCL8023828.1 lytic transglycosylase domain-containing protein [Nocardioides bruguierae]